MDGHDDARPVGQGRLRRRGVEVEVFVADVGERRRRAGLEDRVERGDERERAGDDLVTGLQVLDLQRRHESSGPVVDGDGVLDARQLGEATLELGDHRPLRDHARSQDLQDFGLDLGTELDGGDGDHDNLDFGVRLVGCGHDGTSGGTYRRMGAGQPPDTPSRRGPRTSPGNLGLLCLRSEEHELDPSHGRHR